MANKPKAGYTRKDLLKYTDIFGDDFGEMIKMYQGAMGAELQALLMETMDNMIFDVQDFAVQVKKSVATMESSGMAMEAIEDVLENDMKTGGKVFGKLRNDIKSATVRGVNQSSRLAQYMTYFANPMLAGGTGQMVTTPKNEIKFMWVNVAGHKVCPDCMARFGDVKTYEEWAGEGLPGAGGTVCGSYCYCILDPIGQIDKTLPAPIKTTVTKQVGADVEKIALKNMGNLTPKQIEIYKAAMKMDSENAIGLLMRKGMTRAEAMQEIAEARVKLQSVKIDSKTLNFQVTGQVPHPTKPDVMVDTGYYPRDRAILHARIQRSIVQRGQVASGQADFLMTGGVPGAGKSTMLAQAFPGYKNKFVHVDSDEIKKFLAAYDDDIISWNAGLYHEEADDIINGIFQQSFNQNRHVLFDGTMKTSSKMVDMLDWYIDKGGYKPFVAFVDVEVQTAIERAVARSLQNGRFVEPTYILSHLGKNKATYEILKERYGDALEYIMYNNNVFGADPALIEASGYFDFLQP